MTDLLYSAVPEAQRKETITWSNHLVNTPAVFSLLEKRVLYYLTLQIKHRFIERGLDSLEAWKDLTFLLTDKDLAVIGGKTHVLQTYDALSGIGEKFMSVSYYNHAKQLICAKVHWVDFFAYNTTKNYEVRMSPELMPYLINLSRAFTKFNAHIALSLRSKYSQKFYEFCCEYAGEFRYHRANPSDLAFRKNVFPMHISQLRYLLDLCEKRDERTGKIISKEKYQNFCDLYRSVILPAQQELYELYHNGQSEVWFDCAPFQRTGRKITSIVLFIYSKENPKQGLPKLWSEDDEPLNPFETFSQASLIPKETIKAQPQESTQALLEKIHHKLSTYLEEREVLYYLDYLQHHTVLGYDSCAQVLRVIEEKERQPKFQAGTRAYQRKSIMHYALDKNLMTYGWNIPEPQGIRPHSTTRSA